MTQCRVSVMSRRRSTLGHIAPCLHERVGFRHEPVEFAPIATAQRMLEHRQPKIEPL
jgi:hypothetical protein